MDGYTHHYKQLDACRDNLLSFVIDLSLCQAMHIINLTSWSLSQFTKHIQLNPLGSLLNLWSDNLSDHTSLLSDKNKLGLENVRWQTVIIFSVSGDHQSCLVVQQVFIWYYQFGITYWIFGCHNNCDFKKPSYISFIK